MPSDRSLVEREIERVELHPFALDGFHRRRQRRLRNRRIRAVVVALLVVAVVAGAFGPSFFSGSVPANEPTPTPSGPIVRGAGEVLSFTGHPETPGNLVAVNPETGEERVLVQDLDDVVSATWSADGRWVAYETASPGNGFFELWVVGASREPRLIATGGNPGLFATGSVGWMWSRTGHELLMARRSSLNGDAQTIDRSELSVIDVETGDSVELPSIEGDAGLAPAWSPDRARIVFASGDGGVYSVDLGSGERSLLARLPDMDLDPHPRIEWSPNGTHIAIVSDMGDNGERLYVMDAEGSDVRLVADSADLLLVAWSLDGTQLAFAEGSEADGVVRILVAPMDGADPTEVGSVAFAGCTYNYECGVTWSPDGTAIGFHKREGEDSAIAADGSGEVEQLDQLTYRSWAGGRFGGT